MGPTEHRNSPTNNQSARRTKRSTNNKSAAQRSSAEQLGQHAVSHVRNRGRASRLHLLESEGRNTFEQARAAAERKGHDVQPQLVDQSGGQILVDGGRAAVDP